jgi:hypothetical protein
LFFPEDFAKLPEGTFIYVAEGALININEGNTENVENTETEETEAVSERVKKKHKKHRRKYTKRPGVVYGGPKGPRKKGHMDSKEIKAVNESSEPSEEDEEVHEELRKSKYFEFPRKKVQYSDLHGDAK